MSMEPGARESTTPTRARCAWRARDGRGGGGAGEGGAEQGGRDQRGAEVFCRDREDARSGAHAAQLRTRREGGTPTSPGPSPGPPGRMENHDTKRHDATHCTTRHARPDAGRGATPRRAGSPLPRAGKPRDRSARASLRCASGDSDGCQCHTAGLAWAGGMTCRCLGWISQLEQRTEGTSATGVEVLAGEGVGGGLPGWGAFPADGGGNTSVRWGQGSWKGGGGLRGGRRGVTPLLKAVVGLYLPVGSGGVG